MLKLLQSLETMLAKVSGDRSFSNFFGDAVSFYDTPKCGEVQPTRQPGSSILKHGLSSSNFQTRTEIKVLSLLPLYRQQSPRHFVCRGRAS